MITVKEEFVGCDKICRAIQAAGWEAVGMWLAMKAYAAEKLTDGFVPDEDIDRLRGAPKHPRRSLKALVDCGRIDTDGERGAGLVEAAKLGWQLHDYEDHASSSTEQELRKEKSRERKRKWRAEQAKLLADMQAGQSRGTVTHESSGQTSGPDMGQSRGTRRDSHAQAGTRPRTRAHAPSPAQPSPNLTKEAAAQDLVASGGGKVSGEPEAAAAPVLSDLCESARQVKQSPALAGTLRPEDWPELQAIAGKVHAAAGRAAPRLGQYLVDADVRAIVALLAIGWPAAELEDLAPQLGEWLREETPDSRPRTLAMLTPNVVRIASEQATRAAVVEQQARDLVKATGRAPILTAAGAEP